LVKTGVPADIVWTKADCEIRQANGEIARDLKARGMSLLAVNIENACAKAEEIIEFTASKWALSRELRSSDGSYPLRSLEVDNPAVRGSFRAQVLSHRWILMYAHIAF
jgi:hypothetical protein